MVIMPNNLDSQEYDSQIPTEDGSSKILSCNFLPVSILTKHICIIQNEVPESILKE